MNKYLEKYARDFIKTGLGTLPESNRLVFARLYSSKAPDRPINDVVNSMPKDQLDWAMMQVQNSVDKLTKSA